MQSTILQYRIGRQFGTSSFGSVYSAVHEHTKQEVAIKIVSNPKYFDYLKNEAIIYQLINQAPGFPQFIDFVEEQNRMILVTELLGKNINELFNFLKNPFSLKTILMITYQLLLRLEYLHSKGIIHGDVKPHNLCMGINSKSNQLYLIDFGLARFFNLDTPEVISKFEGTAIFAPIAAHNGEKQFPRDDLESMVYTILYLMNGKLPWNDIQTNDKAARREMICIMKKSLNLRELCANLPAGVTLMFESILKLKPNEIPNYSYYRKTLKEAIIQNGFVYDSRYDWIDFRVQPSFSFPSRAQYTDLRRGSTPKPPVQIRDLRFRVSPNRSAAADPSILRLSRGRRSIDKSGS